MTSYTSESICLGPLIISYPRLWASLIAWVCVIGLFLFLKHTNLGKSMRAAADNREGAKICRDFCGSCLFDCFWVERINSRDCWCCHDTFLSHESIQGDGFLVKSICCRCHRWTGKYSWCDGGGIDHRCGGIGCWSLFQGVLGKCSDLFPSDHGADI